MARKKKEETQEEKPDIKTENKKVNPFGWRAVVNKAKFTKAK